MRQLRKEHPDSHYVNSLFQYVKHFSVHHRNIVTYVSVDDKAVPVGGPKCFISTGVHGHNRSLVPLNGYQLQALDHDFHLFGIVPSVAFFIDVPDNASDSFFRGATFVTNKDKVSSALRHSAEMNSLICLNDGVVASKPILAIVSDGGPDHRVTFGSVQVASLSLFCSLDLDIIVCVRMYPYQSWTNVAERIMSSFNLALQNVSLARSKMSERAEAVLSNKNTLDNVREAIKLDSELGDAVKDSTATPFIQVGQKFNENKGCSC